MNSPANEEELKRKIDIESADIIRDTMRYLNTSILRNDYKILNNFFLKIWYSKSLIYTFISFIFLPLSIIYYIVFNIKNFFQRQNHFNIPIICIGNLVVGGSG
jgi:hypothetical protein